MAETAFQRQYRDEYIAGFEQRQSLLRESVTTEAQIKGNECEFLIADSGGATTVTRGVNGKIPSRGDNLSQVRCTLTEEHDLAIKTGFNVFASQGNQREIMQATTQSVVNRKTDSQIIDALGDATQSAGAATTASLEVATRALAILGNNDVMYDGAIAAAITPGFLAYLMRDDAFTSADYVKRQPLAGIDTAQMEGQGYYDWMNIHWVVHPNLPGAGTADERCFMYHKSAIGHALDTNGLDMKVGFNEEQDYSYCRYSGYMGAKLLQNSGVVVMRHDGSGLAAAAI